MLDQSWAEGLHYTCKQGPGNQAACHYGLEPLLLAMNHVGEYYRHETEMADKHHREEAKHSAARAFDLMYRLLKRESASETLSATPVDIHGVLEKRSDSVEPSLILDLIYCVLKRCPALSLLQEGASLSHEQLANDRRGSDLLRLRHCQVQRSDPIEILKVDVAVSGEQEGKSKLVVVVRGPVDGGVRLGVDLIDVKLLHVE